MNSKSDWAKQIIGLDTNFLSLLELKFWVTPPQLKHWTKTHGINVRVESRLWFYDTGTTGFSPTDYEHMGEVLFTTATVI